MFRVQDLGLRCGLVGFRVQGGFQKASASHDFQASL